jgi:CRP-like cAMP-binding protein
MSPSPPAAALQAAVRASRLAAGLTPEQSDILATRVRLEVHPAGRVLAREGAADNHLVEVVEGSLAVVKNHGLPEEATLLTLMPGDFAHELGFLDGAVRYASLVAATEARVLVLEREGLESLIDSHPRIVYQVMCAIVKTVHRIQTRLSMQASELTNYIVKQHGRY